MIPGEILSSNQSITMNKDKECYEIKVVNLGDRPIQVGSHFHFFEVNKSLEFDRTVAFGCHLDIPAGTSVRFEPGETKTIKVVGFSGGMTVVGFNNLLNANINQNNRIKANELLLKYGFANKNEAT